MNYEKKHKKKSFAQKRKPNKTDLNNVKLAKDPLTPLDVLLRLQINSNPEITLNLALNPSLTVANRYSLAQQVFSYPGPKISLRMKYDLVGLLLEQDFDPDQKKALLMKKNIFKRDLTNLFTSQSKHGPSAPPSLLSDYYDETVKYVSALNIAIPNGFAKKLVRTWYSTLTCMVHLKRQGVLLRSPDNIQINKLWVSNVITQNPYLDTAGLDYENFLDLQNLIFQQTFFMRLLGHNEWKVSRLIDSVSEAAPIYIQGKEDYDVNLRENRRIEYERIKQLAERTEEEVNTEIAHTKFNEFSLQVSKELRPYVFVGSQNAQGLHDNGFSWGVLEENIHSQYSLKFTSKINNYYISRDVQMRIRRLLEDRSIGNGFKDFIDSLLCSEYRGNLRSFTPFPIELFQSDSQPIEQATAEYARWTKMYPDSVLDADRGNVPEEVKDLISGWKTVARFFDESRIFFLDCLGLVCSYSEFKLGFHIAFVAVKAEPNGLRGQWLITLNDLPESFHRDIQVMGWIDLSKSIYRHQTKFQEILARGKTLWIFETNSASMAKAEIGKLIEGLLYERYQMTAIGASSYLREVSTSVRYERQRLLDLILKIRRYRSAMRFRPVLDYCANPSCGLPLSDPQSLARGYGPTCWAKMYKEGVRDYDLTTDYDRLYFQTPVSLSDWQDSLAEFLDEAF